MSTLAGFLKFNTPPLDFLDSITNLSLLAKILLWYSLSLKIRQNYNAAINSYTLFCATHGVKAWLVSETKLIE